MRGHEERNTDDADGEEGSGGNEWGGNEVDRNLRRLLYMCVGVLFKLYNSHIHLKMMVYHDYFSWLNGFFHRQRGF
jgi:hypothetical protein